MNKDVFAKKNLDLHEQLNELKEYVITHGTGMGLSTSDIALIVLLCDEYRAQIIAVINKRSEYLAESARKKGMRKTHLTPLRMFLARMKKPIPGNTAANLPGFKSNLTKPDSDTYKPKLKIDINADKMRVRFKKLGVEQMQFWGSLNGEKFHLLGSRIRSPFFFKPEALKDNAPQKWEIKAIGLLKDEQFGQWSDDVTVLYASGLGS